MINPTWRNHNKAPPKSARPNVILRFIGTNIAAPIKDAIINISINLIKSYMVFVIYKCSGFSFYPITAVGTNPPLKKNSTIWAMNHFLVFK